MDSAVLPNYDHGCTSWQGDGLGGAGKHSILWRFHLTKGNLHGQSKKPRGYSMLSSMVAGVQP